MSPAERLKAWNYKRVFFLTPQVLTNDLSRGACPSVDIKCLVIDEAHKALGNHAYCQVPAFTVIPSCVCYTLHLFKYLKCV